MERMKELIKETKYRVGDKIRVYDGKKIKASYSYVYANEDIKKGMLLEYFDPLGMVIPASSGIICGVAFEDMNSKSFGWMQTFGKADILNIENVLLNEITDILCTDI